MENYYLLIIKKKKKKEQTKFSYSPLGKVFEKLIKTIEDQGSKQVKAIKDSNALVKNMIMILKKISKLNLKQK